jgi:hypothetical protein
MPWEPGTLLGLQDSTKPFGKYPGASLFVMLENDKITAGVIVLTPHGTKALIPKCYLMPMPGATPVPPGPTPHGGGGVNQAGGEEGSRGHGMQGRKACKPAGWMV